MISGNIYNPMLKEQLSVLPAPLSCAIRYFSEHDMAAHQPGVFSIDLEGVPAILQVLDLKTGDRSGLRPEIHRKNVDVQFLASGGPEEAGFYTDDGNGQVEENLLDTPRDILFYKNEAAAPEGRIHLIPGSFAVYFPWDVHIPAIKTGDTETPIRKIVIKVPLESCLPDSTR